MGRPKVLPANRLRANTACTACRASKKRCSGSFPCSNCIHKGRARSCIPFKSIPDSPVRTRPSAGSNLDRNVNLNWENLTAEPQSPLISPHNDFADPQQEHALEVGPRSPEATHRTHARMLLNLQGERGIVLTYRKQNEKILSVSNFMMQFMLEKPLLSLFSSFYGTPSHNISGPRSSRTISEARICSRLRPIMIPRTLMREAVAWMTSAGTFKFSMLWYEIRPDNADG
jgi:hypothetical protein